MREFRVEAQGIRVASPGDRQASIDDLPTHLFGMGARQIEDRVNDEDMANIGVSGGYFHQFINHVHWRACAPHSALDDRICAVVASKRAASLRLQRFDSVLSVVAGISQSSIGARKAAHVQKTSRRGSRHFFASREVMKVRYRGKACFLLQRAD